MLKLLRIPIAFHANLGGHSAQFLKNLRSISIGELCLLKID